MIYSRFQLYRIIKKREPVVIKMQGINYRFRETVDSKIRKTQFTGSSMEATGLLEKKIMLL